MNASSDIRAANKSADRMCTRLREVLNAYERATRRYPSGRLAPISHTLAAKIATALRMDDELTGAVRAPGEPQ